MADTYKALEYAMGDWAETPEQREKIIAILRRLDAAQGAVDGVMTRVIAFEACSYDPEAGAIALQQVRASVEDLAIGQQWRPISEAPRDGTHIILTNGVSVAEGWWEHEEPYIREQRDLDGRYIDQQEHDGFDDWLDCGGGMQPDPTFWMPLPPAPKEPSHV